MKTELTERGFVFGLFKDLYENRCVIQKSSLATPACIWLGRDEMRMHLTQQHVRMLLPMLQYFADTGELPAASAPGEGEGT